MGTEKRSFNDTDYYEYASKHLRYEIEMLTFITSELSRITSEQGNKGLLNAVLESFIIHARNLIDFLFPSSQEQPNRHDDITIRDYLLQEYLEKSLSRPPVLKDAKNLANKTIAHLTIERRTKFQTPQDRNIRFNDIYAQIYNAFTTIIPLTNPQRFPREVIDVFKPIDSIDKIYIDAVSHTSSDINYHVTRFKPPELFDDN